MKYYNNTLLLVAKMKSSKNRKTKKLTNVHNNYGSSENCRVDEITYGWLRLISPGCTQDHLSTGTVTMGCDVWPLGGFQVDGICWTSHSTRCLCGSRPDIKHVASDGYRKPNAVDISSANVFVGSRLTVGS